MDECIYNALVKINGNHKPIMKEKIPIILIEYFRNNKYNKVKINNNEYPCKTNLPCENGYYKNGWRSCVTYNKKGREFLQLDIYTTRSGNIDIERRFQIDILKQKLVRDNGFDNSDLLKLYKKDECVNIDVIKHMAAHSNIYPNCVSLQCEYCKTMLKEDELSNRICDKCDKL